MTRKQLPIPKPGVTDEVIRQIAEETIPDLEHRSEALRDATMELAKTVYKKRRIAWMLQPFMLSDDDYDPTDLSK